VLARGFSGEALADLARPVLDEMETRVRRTVDGTIHHGRTAALDVVDRSGLEARRAIADGEEAGRRTAAVAARHGRAVLSDLQLRVQDQEEAFAESVHGAIRRWGDTNEDLSDSVMAKVLVVALNLVLAYAGYLWVVGHERTFDWAAVARIVWGASSVVAATVFVLFRVGGRDRRLRHLLVWELYFAALAAVATVGLLVAETLHG
jgi:hypothetical protein